MKLLHPGEPMPRHLIGYLASALLLLPAAPASAAPPAQGPAVYDTIDAVEVWADHIVITGIISGQSSPSELSYTILDGSSTSTPGGAARCDRLAMLAVAKPGKYQFATVLVPGFGSRFGCKLIVRTP
jgi:hypothetical protein